MNGEVCCILGVCCPPGSEAQALALEAELVRDEICTKNPDAKKVAAWILANFDLAPKGSVAPFVSQIAKMARGAKG